MASPRHQKKPTKAPSAKSRSRVRASAANPSVWRRHERDLWIVALTVAGLFIALAEASALGPVGRGIAQALSVTLGIGRLALPVIFIALAGALGWGKGELDRARLGWGVVLGLLSVCGLGDLGAGRPGLRASVATLARAGGWLGVAVGGGLDHALGLVGALVALAALLIIAVIIATGVGLRVLARVLARGLRASGSLLSRWWTSRPDIGPSFLGDTPHAHELDEGVNHTLEADRATAPEPVVTAPASEEADVDSDYGDDYVEAADEPYEPFEDDELRPVARSEHVASLPVFSSDWELPPSGLLIRTKEQKQDRNAIEAAGEELVDALHAHGVETTLVGYTVGPAVTRFELELGPGVKVSRVTSLNKDIAYAMASPDVRILAPIPGRSAIGVEVPNRQRTLVALGDLLATEEALSATHPLDVPIGRDIAGKTVVVNLGEMPHVLISGATGAGKSSCINSLITSLVMRASPDEVRLILVDPKRVEMGQYNDLPHLLSPVVVDPKKAAAALAWAVKEMERRYDILAESGARDITSYQQMIARGELETPVTTQELVGEVFERATGLESDATVRGPEILPYVVIVVDELNDLMMVAARDVEESVVRIAQMARAVGIHLVLATQRPSVDVITGVIKANVPSRMAFAVSSLADSRVILDQAGAERLIGKGDMLLVTASSNIARRLQSPWVSEDEVRRVVEYWRAQGGRSETVVALDVPASRVGSSSSSGDDDAILRQARELVIRAQSGSTSMLQRKLRVGFARAGRIMDQLEEEGVVAPGDGSKARKVLIGPDEYDPHSA